MPTRRSIYLNLPVADLDRSVAFFTTLGFTLNPHFSNETAAGMSITDQIFIMLHTHGSFARFTPGKKIADAARDAEILIALDAPNRANVDDYNRSRRGRGRQRIPGDHGLRLDVRTDLRGPGRAHLGDLPHGHEPDADGRRRRWQRLT